MTFSENIFRKLIPGFGTVDIKSVLFLCTSLKISVPCASTCRRPNFDPHSQSIDAKYERTRQSRSNLKVSVWNPILIYCVPKNSYLELEGNHYGMVHHSFETPKTAACYGIKKPLGRCLRNNIHILKCNMVLCQTKKILEKSKLFLIQRFWTDLLDNLLLMIFV